MKDKNLQFSCEICHYYNLYPGKIVASTPALHSTESGSVTNDMMILRYVADPFHLIMDGGYKLMFLIVHD
jgi:hypothetical protein